MGASGAGNAKQDKLNLNIVSLTEFILSHEELAAQPERGECQADNAAFFQTDLLEGKLDRYAGTFVAYQQGILCGQSADRQKLYDTAERYYGGSSLTVFPVPKQKNRPAIDEAVANAIQ